MASNVIGSFVGEMLLLFEGLYIHQFYLTRSLHIQLRFYEDECI
jgi:hypothetical protein